MNYFLKKLSWQNLCVVCYALFGLKTALLAFASDMYMPWFGLLMNGIGICCIPLGVVVLLKQQKISLKNGILFLIPLFYALFTVFHTYGGFKGKGMFSCAVIAIFLLFVDRLKLKIFKLFFILLLVQCAFSLLLWIIYVYHLPVPLTEVPYYSSLQIGVGYIKWGIFAIYKGGDSLRLCGIFNEPGALGTTCALTFIATFSHSKKWQKFLLLASGFFTYSLAFYLLIFLFFCFYLVRKNLWHIVWLLFMPILFLQIPNIDFGNNSLNRLAQRFAVSDTKGLVGNNRSSEQFDYEFSIIANSNAIFLGKGMRYEVAQDDTHGNASWKLYVVQMGFIGFDLFLLLWIVGGMIQANRNIDCYILLFLFLLSAYQRPWGLINIYGHIILFGGMLYIQHVKLLDLESGISRK